MLDLFANESGYRECDVANLLGLSRQTLRNWRCGYTTASGTFIEPVMIEGTHWWKQRKTPRAPVMISHIWVAKQLEIKRIKEAL